MGKHPTEGIQSEAGSLVLAYRPVVRGYLLGAGLYYLLIVFAHSYYETGWVRVGMVALAAATCLACLGARWLLGRMAAPALALEVCAAVANALLFANVASYFQVHFEVEKLVYFVLIALAFATCSPTRRVMLPSVGVALLSLWPLAQAAGPKVLELYTFIGLAAAFVAIGMGELMRGALKREVRARLAAEASALRLEEERRRIAALQAQTHDLAVQAQAASRAKSEFLATVSHELRTPMNAILGMAQAMAPGLSGAAQAEQLKTIQGEGRGLRRLIDDLIDLSSLEANHLELHPIAFDMGEMLDGLAEAHRPAAADKGLGFTVEAGPGVRDWCRGDDVWLRRMLSNLISNAVKFTEAGHVAVTARRIGDRLTFDVADTGIGVGPEQMPTLFDRFVQADGSPTRQFGGAGLGLAIVKELVDLMGGEIAVAARPGGGSCFSLVIPAPVVAPPAHVRSSAERPIEAPGALNILVVDDNHINRLVLQTLLGQWGVASDMVENGREAVDAWANGDWDAILMDIHMPQMDGIAATREIRTREQAEGRARTPIIAVTASVLDHETRSYMAAGMDGCVAKPIEFAQLAAVLQQALADRQSPRASAA